MISGGGGGLRYLPNANAAAATSTSATSHRNEATVPSLWAQRSHRLAPNRARQPFRASCSPHSIQKFAARIARGFSGVANYIPLHKSSNGLWIDSLRANWLSLFARHLSNRSKFVVSRYLSGYLCLGGEITRGKHFPTETPSNHRVTEKIELRQHCLKSATSCKRRPVTGILTPPQQF